MMLVKIYIEQNLQATGWECRGVQKSALVKHLNGKDKIGTGTIEPRWISSIGVNYNRMTIM